MVPAASPAAGLPLPPELLGIRRRGARAPRCLAGRLARRAPRLPMRALACWRLRSGTEQEIRHGYAAPNLVGDLQLFVAHALGGVGEGEPTQTAAGTASGAARRSRADQTRCPWRPHHPGTLGNALGCGA